MNRLSSELVNTNPRHGFRRVITLGTEFPKIVCICGSTKFKKEFEEANRRLTMAGYIVLTVGFFGHADNVSYTEEQKKLLDVLHKHKIELADVVLILNIGGYIGSSTLSEAEFSNKIKKPVVYAYLPSDETPQDVVRLVDQLFGR